MTVMTRQAAHAAIVDILINEVGELGAARALADDILVAIWPQSPIHDLAQQAAERLHLPPDEFVKTR